MLNQQDAIALVDSCLDTQMPFRDIVTRVQSNTGLGIIMASDIAVTALKESKHPLALMMLYRIRNNISRYRNLQLRQFSEVLDDGQ